jgi:GYF domain 2
MAVDEKQFHFRRPILDSGCYMLDDQAMADQWFIRVDDREFGPADLPTLREWKAEGRVLPTNAARRTDLETWSTAAEIPGLFAATTPPVPVEPSQPGPLSPAGLPIGRRNLGQIFTEAFRTYRKGALLFVFFALLVAVPGFFLQFSLPSFGLRDDGTPVWNVHQLDIVPISLLVLFALLWPIFLAGIQLTAAALAEGRDARLADLVKHSIRLWPRMAWLSLLVYGSYFIFSGLPLALILALIGGQVSAFSILLALMILAFQVYMTARLWVNFMFWQQSAALNGLPGVTALRESKRLARSRGDEHWLKRPLYRGALIVSIWIAVVIVIDSIVPVPFLMFHLRGITSIEQARTIVQNLTSAHHLEPIMWAAYATTAFVNALIRPLLGIAFVILYFDAKADDAIADRMDDRPETREMITDQ